LYFAPNVNPTRNTHDLEIGCYGTFFLSRTDLQVLDQYAEEFGELIIRFLKIIFLSILRSQNDIGAREAIGLRMAQRYLQAFERSEGTSVCSPSTAAGRKLIAALWEDGRVFSDDSLRVMRLLAPHLDRAVRLQARLSSADLARIWYQALSIASHMVSSSLIALDYRCGLTGGLRRS